MISFNACLFLLFTFLTNACTTYNDRVVGKLAESSPGEFSAQTLVYMNHKKTKLEGDLFIPENKKNVPLVILIHGGGWAKGKREQMTPIAEKFARAGIAVFNISYRFAPKFHWPAQRQDVEDALAFMLQNREKFSLDTNRIAAFGYSAGAHLALMLAYHPDRKSVNSKPLVAVAGGGSPVDLTAWPEGELVVKFIGHPYSTHAHLYKEASPIEYVSVDSPPTYLYHGKHDWIVEVEQSEKLVAALNKVGVESHFYSPFFGHVNTFLFDDAEVNEVLKFFKGKFQKKDLVSQQKLSH